MSKEDASTLYDTLATSSNNHEERVEVNQRALIDKILARYATAGAVYRELLQNSNDANASKAELYYTTEPDSKIVSSVMYRNNGMPFRPQDWSRLKKIAEGNPDETKIGAFGVGAYSMFSICEQPIVMSGNQALAFIWKGDALWTRRMDRSKVKTSIPMDDEWTSFLMPSRDPYPLPSFQEFGRFLCSSLTFTKNLSDIQVFVNGVSKLHITKILVEPPSPVQISRSVRSSAFSSSSALSGLWNMSTAKFSSKAMKSYPNALFLLSANTDKDTSFLESKYHFQVQMDGTTASMLARYIVAIAKTNIPSQLAHRMERVTKKKPPAKLEIQILLNGQQQQDEGDDHSKKKRGFLRKTSKAEKIVNSVSPSIGAGRIFIGFQTSQTTGLAAHLAAPFVPTVEREAMDLQDPSLRQFNMELLELSGRCMRLVLEHGMMVIGMEYVNNATKRKRWEVEYLKDLEEKQKTKKAIEQPKQEAGYDVDDDDDDDDDDQSRATTSSTSSSAVWGFAKFMAKGVKKRIVKVMTSVEEMVDSASADAELLQPYDPIPLCQEEQEAIIFMQAFLPQQSTPDPMIGTTLAQGFVRCIADQAPPVLTRTGVVPGSQGKLPNYGMQLFCPTNGIRDVVYQHAPEYHTVIAQCQKVSLQNLLDYFAQTVLSQDDIIRFFKWWVKYSRINHETMQETRRIAHLFKKRIKFELAAPGNKTMTIHKLEDYLFYWDSNIIRPVENLSIGKSTAPLLDLPMPDAMIPRLLQDELTDRILSDDAVTSWVEPLPLEIWMEYVSYHPAMTSGQMEHHVLRCQILALLNQEYVKRRGSGQVTFGEYCQSLLRDKRCIPFDADDAKPAAVTTSIQDDAKNEVTYVADCPANLYLASAELQAFSGIASGTGHTFHKVSSNMFKSNILSENFCIALGVRKSVSVDFLFANLDTLKWSTNPKPLVEYLRSALPSLSKTDLTKLRSSQYLPCETDASRMFAPHELYLPPTSNDAQLRHFASYGIIRLLQWPNEKDELTERSQNGSFLIQTLGMQTKPPLVDLLHCIATMIPSESHEIRISCLEYVCNELKPNGGAYTQVYQSRISKSQKGALKILPCSVNNPIDGTVEKHINFSPIHCCASQHCSVMGFPVLDEGVLGKDRLALFASRFQIVDEPSPTACIQQLQNLVQKAKHALTNDSSADLAAKMVKVFADLFGYLSSRSSDLTPSILSTLNGQAFIPIFEENSPKSAVTWYRSEEVFFKSQDDEASTDNAGHDYHSVLFQTITFSPFLAAAGVKHEASTKDLFRLLLESPQNVLNIVKTEEKYRMLLRRIAANPPFSKVTAQIKNSPFLLAFTVSSDEKDGIGGKETKDNKEDPSDDTDGKDGTRKSRSFELAKAEDIYIVDNSFFGRMFSVKQAPPESDLEEFYAKIGSKYISKEVDKRFDVVGEQKKDTRLTLELAKCLQERCPLLVSPSITSRPLVDGAAKMLDTDTNLQICQAVDLKAIFSLGNSMRSKRTTCCCFSLRGKHKNSLFVTKDFDWFDVGYAIGELILKRCQLEDAFFISSLLDAPLEQLRARGFPVDRIIKLKPIPLPKPPVVPTPPPPTVSQTAQAASVPSTTVAAAAARNIPSSATPASSANSGGDNPDGTYADLPPKADAPKPKSTEQKPSAQKAPEPADMSPDDYVRVLKQMFPDADEKHLKSRLGPNPTLDDLRIIADDMATNGRYPREGDSDDRSTTSTGSNKLLGSKKLGRAFNNFRRSNAGNGIEASASSMASAFTNKIKDQNDAGALGGAGAGGGGPVAGPASNESQSRNSNQPIAPEHDAAAHSNMERMLEQTVGQSTKVNQQGINSPERHAVIPEGLDRGSACEVIPGHNLKPFKSSNASGQTHNSIRVFSARLHQSSEDFLQSNFDVVENFAVVIERLCRVYGLDLSSVAIFHDPTGGTIAFNSNRALHFNVRFFHSLHFLQNTHQSQECYSYWYIVFAHELAHHVVSAHNKEHGFYTESYASLYLPKLMSLFTL